MFGCSRGGGSCAFSSNSDNSALRASSVPILSFNLAPGTASRMAWIALSNSRSVRSSSRRHDTRSVLRSIRRRFTSLVNSWQNSAGPSPCRQAGHLLARAEGRTFSHQSQRSGPRYPQHLAPPSGSAFGSTCVVTLHLNRDNILSEVGSGEGISLQCESASGLTGLGVVFRPLHDGNGSHAARFIVCWKPDNINPVLDTLRNAFKEAMLIRP